MWIAHLLNLMWDEGFAWDCLDYDFPDFFFLIKLIFLIIKSVYIALFHVTWENRHIAYYFLLCLARHICTAACGASCCLPDRPTRHIWHKAFHETLQPHFSFTSEAQVCWTKAYDDFKVVFFHPRPYLAALHYNENTGRPQATSTSGELLYRVNFSKSKCRECTAKPVKAEPTFRKFYSLLFKPHKLQ